MATALPLAALAGLLVGVPLAIWTSEWRLGVMAVLGVPAVVGLVLAAIEDGRVQHRVERDLARTGGRDERGVSGTDAGYPDDHEHT